MSAKVYQAISGWFWVASKAHSVVFEKAEFPCQPIENGLKPRHFAPTVLAL
jgi:hypothetical protein